MPRNKKILLNPFKPTAGAEPPVLIGREHVVDDFRNGIAEGVGAPARLMRITGPRGSGKTVLLTEFGDVAREYHWHVVDVTASDSLVQDIMHLLDKDRITGEISVEADLGPLKAHASTAARQQDLTLRDMLTSVTTHLARRHAGLLVTVDEIQDASEADVRELAAAVQHLVREGKDIAFAFAGLTTGVMDLINGRALTFLRRALAEELAAIPLDEVGASMLRTIENAGLMVDDDALAYFVPRTSGYAYLIQLVGYCVFSTARRHADESGTVTVEDAKAGVTEAMRAFASVVQEPAVAGLPQRGIEYLIAMASDDGSSRTREVARRMGLDASQLTSTRRLLIKKQVIEAPARGVVRFSIPHMREFVLDNQESLLARY